MIIAILFLIVIVCFIFAENTTTNTKRILCLLLAWCSRVFFLLLLDNHFHLFINSLINNANILFFNSHNMLLLFLRVSSETLFQCEMLIVLHELDDSSSEDCFRWYWWCSWRIVIVVDGHDMMSVWRVYLMMVIDLGDVLLLYLMVWCCEEFIWILVYYY